MPRPYKICERVRAMKAIQFNLTMPRYALGLALSKVYEPILWSGLSCTSAREVPEPKLLGDEWVKIKTRYGGICGTDTSAIWLKTSPYYSPFSSSPFTFGHENVGTIVEAGAKAGAWRVGQRVVVNPLLWCKPRGFTDLCASCARGDINVCLRFAEGALAPGILTGACRDTGGSWSAYFLAHTSQLHAVPDSVSDENALMVEPFACGLHPVLVDFPQDDETILILGAGTIGLVQLAALRALGVKAKILVAARYLFQAEAAKRLGASEVLTGGDLYAQVAEHTGARLYKAIIGKRVMVGGADRTYECVGSDAALDDALRLTRQGGKVILSGIHGLAKGVDWTGVAFKELDVRASNTYTLADPWNGKPWDTFEVAIDLLARGAADLGWMVSHRYRVEDYGKALRAAGDRKESKMIKGVFEFGG